MRLFVYKNTVWKVDFETPVCKIYCLFLPMLPKKKKKVLLPTGVSKSTAHTVIDMSKNSNAHHIKHNNNWGNK
jgi:hypothetical protein